MIFKWCDSKETPHVKQYGMKDNHTQRASGIDLDMAWLETSILSVGTPLEDLGLIGTKFHESIQYTS